MTQDIRDVLKLALEALERFEGNKKLWPEAITAIKEALAQTQEPVAWISPKGHIHFDPYLDSVPLHTHPPQRSESSGKPSAWVDLTDEEIDNINYTSAHMLAREVLAKFKEKNT